MGLSFIGHSPSFNNWVFSVNGKELVARNFSTPSPLQLNFKGFWDKHTYPLINTSGFNISDSTDTIVVWQWAGKQYTSWWKAISADDEDPEAEITLMFGPPVPYSGPATSPVGTTVVKTKDEREAAEAAAAAVSTKITPSAQLSTEPPVQQSPAPETPKTVTVSPTGPNVQFNNKTKEDIEASTAYKTYAYSNQTPVTSPVPYTPPPQRQTSVGVTRSPVLTAGTKDAREAAEAAAAAGPDWAKLALQLGAAYLLLS